MLNIFNYVYSFMIQIDLECFLYPTQSGFTSINPPTIETLQLQVAAEVKTSQLPVLTVDPNVHTGTFLTGFYCHFGHPEQYQTMILPVKNSWLIFTCKCTNYM